MERSPEAIAPLHLSVEERPGVCPQHGEYVARNLNRGRVWSRCPECAAVEQAAEDERRRADAVRAAERRHADALDSARIPARFIGRTFDTFVADTDPVRHALTVARDYAEAFDSHRQRGTGLILSGMPGTGKSHLAAAILQTMLERDVRYLTCMDLIRAVRETWRRDSERSESQVLGYLERLDLLAVDEVGVQYGTDGEQTILFDVLDRRYREVRPTILLTNQDKDGFKKFIGERAYDRLTETNRWVAFDWPSYRPQARRAAQ